MMPSADGASCAGLQAGRGNSQFDTAWESVEGALGACEKESAGKRSFSVINACCIASTWGSHSEGLPVLWTAASFSLKTLVWMLSEFHRALGIVAEQEGHLLASRRQGAKRCCANGVGEFSR